jgi:membrane protease YdiL (CAAX protease family)
MKGTPAMKSFASKHPVLVVLACLLLWMVASLLFSLLAAQALDRSLFDDLTQSIGTLSATALLLLATWRLGWLKAAGVARFGGWQVWLIALGIIIYTYLTTHYAFFDTVRPTFGLMRTSAAQGIFLRQLVVGFVEESVFRGVLLYVLIHVWGGSRGGVYASAVVTALLFGSLHILQLLSGNAMPDTLLTMLLSTLSGIWLAGLVLRWGSIWPAALLHATGNMVVGIGALAFGNYTPQPIDFVQLVIFEVPLALWGAWLLWKLPLRAVPDQSPVEASSQSTSIVEPARP